MRRIVKAGCNSKQLDVVMEHAELLEWTVEDEDLLLKIYDSFWPNERCVLFFTSLNGMPEAGSRPIFGQHIFLKTVKSNHLTT